jgi:hypothetical protein
MSCGYSSTPSGSCTEPTGGKWKAESEDDVSIYIQVNLIPKKAFLGMVAGSNFSFLNFATNLHHLNLLLRRTYM